MRPDTGSSGRPSCRPWPPAAPAPVSRDPTHLSSTGQGSISSQYGADIGITAYELDLFGRIQSLKDQALENYLAQIETQRSTQIALIASVANAYLTLLADQELLALSQATLRDRAGELCPDPAQVPAGGGLRDGAGAGAHGARERPGQPGAIPASGETGQKRAGRCSAPKCPVLEGRNRRPWPR